MQMYTLKWHLVALTVMVVFGMSLLFVSSIQADVLKTEKGEIEGRILEQSANVLVLETITGAYVVIARDQVKAVIEEPEPEFYYRRAQFHNREGDETRALTDFLETLNRSPQHKSARKGIEEINQRRQKRRWNNGLQEATNHLDNKDYKQAIVAYQHVLDMEPDEVLTRQILQRLSETHSQMAYLYYDHCYEEGAILELAKAEELSPNSAEIYYILGRIHKTDRKFELARTEFERALEIQPNHSAAREHLDEIIRRTRRYASWYE